MDAHVSMCKKRDGEIWKRKFFTSHVGQLKVSLQNNKPEGGAKLITKT